MRVVTYDPYVPQTVLEQAGVERVEFAELVKMSDYISIHTPLLARDASPVQRGSISSDEARRGHREYVARARGG